MMSNDLQNYPRLQFALPPRALLLDQLCVRTLTTARLVEVLDLRKIPPHRNELVQRRGVLADAVPTPRGVALSVGGIRYPGSALLGDVLHSEHLHEAVLRRVHLLEQVAVGGAQA